MAILDVVVPQLSESVAEATLLQWHKKVGDKITVNIQPENAYGQVREDLFVKVPLDKMPGEVQVGQSLQAVGDDNRPVQVIIKEVNEDHVVIDGNHPLAGKELVFDIEVVSVQ